MSNYQEQWDRTKRWFEAIKQIENGERDNSNLPKFKDEYIAFFITCYHLADYIKRDESLDIPEDKIYGYIRSSEALKVCKDVANASKHLELDSRAETTQDTELADGLDAELSLPSGEVSVSCSIELQDGQKDAFVVAEKCMCEWKSLLQQEEVI
jgi:hypothetical protein